MTITNGLSINQWSSSIRIVHLYYIQLSQKCFRIIKKIQQNNLSWLMIHTRAEFKQETHQNYQGTLFTINLCIVQQKSMKKDIVIQRGYEQMIINNDISYNVILLIGVRQLIKIYLINLFLQLHIQRCMFQSQLMSSRYCQIIIGFMKQPMFLGN
ncbi:hypothetical protein pb186bvf_010475 [Paramecium bursaria]